MKNIAIIGAGMAGFGAAYQFYKMGIPATIYEKNAYHGGHAASFCKDGFVFDDGPHISFTKNKRLQDLFASSIDDKYESVKASVNNYWKSYWIKHPAQCNLYGLPTDLVVDVLEDFIKRDTTCQVNNYKDWLYASFGKKFAETFPMQYTIKFHTTTASNMDTDWMGPRLYKANLKEVLQGALTPSTPDVHYVDDFRYPTHGGFVRILDTFLSTTKIMLNHKIEKIDHVSKIITLANGAQSEYEALISTMPLPELIPIIQDIPKNVREAAEKLACSSCVLINLGIDRADISQSQWTYFYDKDIIFTRLSFPHMLSPFNTPEGAGSIQAEIYFSNKYKQLDREPEEYISATINDLKRCGLTNDDDRVLFSEARVAPYANVIFDMDRRPALKIVHSYLDDIGIGYAGRYGQWGYHWTDESFISGEQAAQNILDKLQHTKNIGNNTSSISSSQTKR